MKATAIYIKTENSAEYLYCVEGELNAQSALEYLEMKLGDDVRNISEFIFDGLGYDFGYKETYAFNNLLD